MVEFQPIPTHSRFKGDLTGQPFGMWEVLGYAGKSVWWCQCSCRKRTIKRVPRQALVRGASKSCHGESVRYKNYGYSKTTEYQIWKGIRDRCLSPACPRYRYYGGRGIRMCERWLESFESFLADMGPRPSPQHSIDRIDNDGDYEPGNCVWATKRTQGRNRRSNRMLTLNGRTMCVVDWAEMLGMPLWTLQGRLKRGWEVERALTQPFGKPSIKSG